MNRSQVNKMMLTPEYRKFIGTTSRLVHEHRKLDQLKAIHDAEKFVERRLHHV